MQIYTNMLRSYIGGKIHLSVSLSCTINDYSINLAGKYPVK